LTAAAAVAANATMPVAALSTTLSTAALDKHPQSKERGITLDLGFSSFTVGVKVDEAALLSGRQPQPQSYAVMHISMHHLQRCPCRVCCAGCNLCYLCLAKRTQKMIAGFIQLQQACSVAFPAPCV
jgi:hypothetical protein